MTRSKPWVLLILILTVGIVSFLCLRFILNSGANLPDYGFSFGCMNLTLSTMSGYFALQVHRFKQRKSSWITAVGAARVAAFALSMSHLGSIMTGYFAANLGLLAANLDNEALMRQIWSMSFGLFTAIVMLTVGILTEKVCFINPRDPKSGPSGAAPATA